VCKQKGHEAGFKGATYIDCPKKPCFLCKQPGHTTMTCPHRIATEHGVAPAPRRYILGPFDFVYERQIRNHVNKVKPTIVIPNQMDCAIKKFHSRRITCLEFHPTKNNILVSGDKKGQIGIWDYEKVIDNTVYDSVHSCIVNSIKFHPVNSESIYTSGSDGTISCTDIETGLPVLLMDLNPDGWNGPSTWRMLYGMDINSEKGLVLVADNFGLLYQMDTFPLCDELSMKTILICAKHTAFEGNIEINRSQNEEIGSCEYLADAIIDFTTESTPLKEGVLDFKAAIKKPFAMVQILTPPLSHHFLSIHAVNASNDRLSAMNLPHRESF
ncbi:hypothetical protein KI387_002707, partial [Taxus chinensis]